MPTNQWIGEDYYNIFGVKNPKPGFGTASDTEGYFTGPGQYMKYADMGLGEPNSFTVESSGGEAGAPSSMTQVQPNAQMQAKYPIYYGPDESFLGGLWDSVKSSLSEPYLPAMLGFGLGALGGFSGPGDWFGGSSTGGGVGAGSGGGGTGGGMDLDNWDLFGSGGTDNWDLLGGGSPGNSLDYTTTGTVPEGWEGWKLPDVNAQGLMGTSKDILSTLATKVGPTAAKSLFSKFMESGDPKDLMSILGAAAPGLLSEFFNAQRSSGLQSSLENIANQARADRSPFLDYAKSTLAGGPGAYAATGPGGDALRAVLHKLSPGFGNPIGSPAALGIATDSANRTWQDDWRQAANIGLGGNYSQLATNAATAGAGTTGAGFGDAAANIFGTKDDLGSLLKRLQSQGLNLGGLTSA